jgi:hypothetical protein
MNINESMESIARSLNTKLTEELKDLIIQIIKSEDIMQLIKPPICTFDGVKLNIEYRQTLTYEPFRVKTALKFENQKLKKALSDLVDSIETPQRLGIYEVNPDWTALNEAKKIISND